MYLTEDSLSFLNFKFLYFDADTKELYYLKNSDIFKVSVHEPIQNSVKICSTRLTEKNRYQTEKYLFGLQTNMIQYHPSRDYIYEISVKEDDFERKDDSKLNKRSKNFSQRTNLNEFMLLKKYSLIDSTCYKIQLPENTNSIKRLSFGYFLIFCQNKKQSKEMIEESEEYYDMDSDNKFYIYKEENNILVIYDSIDNINRRQLRGNQEIINDRFIYCTDSILMLYNLLSRKKINLCKIKGENDIYTAFEYNADMNKLICYNFLAKNVIIDLNQNKILNEFKAHTWQQKSSGFLNKDYLYTSNGEEIFIWNNNLDKLFQIFIHEDGGFYIQDSSGSYYANRKIIKDLHYVDKKNNVVGFEQLDPFCNKPSEIISEIHEILKIRNKEVVSLFKNAQDRRFSKLNLDNNKLKNAAFSFPIAEIKNDKFINYENFNGKIVLKYSFKDSVSKLIKYNILINEVPLYGSRGKYIDHLNTFEYTSSDTLRLTLGENKIQVAVMNELGLENFKYPTYVNYTPVNNTIVAKTHYIGIGVNHFKDQNHDLKYCVNDVTDLALDFNGKKTVTKLFTDQKVTRENILKLKQYLKDSTTIHDKVIISFSSHGLLDDSLNFYLATHDVDFRHPEKRGIKYEELEDFLDSIPARKKLLLLDACNSGENDKTELLEKDLNENSTKLDSTQELAARGTILKLRKENQNKFQKLNELFVNVRNNTGSVIISAAGGQQSALEAIEVDGKKIENGAFTYSVLEYLNKHKGDAYTIKISELKQYVEDHVQEITNGKQKPTSRQETMDVDWEVR